MKKPLPYNYDITVTNMIDMTIEQEVNGFVIRDADFYNRSGKLVKMRTLCKEGNGAEIYQMKDGKFVIEDCSRDYQGDDIEYFYSDNLADLTT